jgi:hypothetical protein
MFHDRRLELTLPTLRRDGGEVLDVGLGCSRGASRPCCWARANWRVLDQVEPKEARRRTVNPAIHQHGA